MQTFYLTDVGKVREHNEDNVIILNNDGKYESSLQEDNGRTLERYWINL